MEKRTKQTLVRKRVKKQVTKSSRSHIKRVRKTKVDQYKESILCIANEIDNIYALLSRYNIKNIT